MNETVWDWLPDDGLDCPALRSHLKERLASWVSDWFVEAPFLTEIWTVSTIDVALCSSPNLRCRQGVVLLVSSALQSLMTMRSLGLHHDLSDLTPADKALIDGFGRELLGDLVRSLSVFDSASQGQSEGETLWPPRPDRCLRVRLDMEGVEEELEIFFPFRTLVPLRKRLAAKSNPETEALTSMRAAAANLPIDVEVILGSADLSLKEFRHLAPGDVVILATPLDGVAHIRLASTGRTLRAARFTSDNDLISLTVCPFPEN